MIQNAVILSCDKMAIPPQLFGPNSCKVLTRIQVHQNCRCYYFKADQLEWFFKREFAYCLFLNDVNKSILQIFYKDRRKNVFDNMTYFLYSIMTKVRKCLGFFIHIPIIYLLHTIYNVVFFMITAKKSSL